MLAVILLISLLLVVGVKNELTYHRQLENILRGFQHEWNKLR